MTWARRVYEGVMAALAIAVLAMLPVEAVWADRANTAIWAVFAADYVIRLVASDDRRAFVRANVIDLIAVIPIDVLRGGRLLRLVRLVRLARSASILWRVSADFRGVLRTNGLAWALTVTLLMMITGAVSIMAVEPAIGTFPDALWWTVVTTSTVGYGDISPATNVGRTVAGVLMIVGIGTLGMITASIATYFVRQREEPDLDPHLAALRDQLQRWNALTVDERRRAAAVLAALAETAGQDRELTM